MKEGDGWKGGAGRARRGGRGGLRKFGIMLDYLRRLNL